MDKGKFLRQWKIVDVTKIKGVGIIGAGSIGSWVALSLAKLGVEDITVWDFDTVEEHNGPNQVYRVSDLGRPKVVALKEIISDLAGVEINIVEGKYDGDAKPLMICAVDDIKTREEIFDEFIYMNFDIERYWDARMGGEFTTIISLKPTDQTDIKEYREMLFPEEEAEELPCGERTVGYNTQFIADFLTNQIKCQAMKEDVFKRLDFSWKPFQFNGRTKDGKFYSTMVKE